MKVGVDGVLIGCWTDVRGAGRILDVGTGCGLIALIMAQRAPAAHIDAIDIDVPSIEEAAENIAASPWSDRVSAFCCGYSEVSSMLQGEGQGYDLIISNPPYFDSGVTETVTAREKARHQGDLSPSTLLRGACNILTPGGSVSMVMPYGLTESIERQAADLGYRLTRKCLFRGHEGAPYKRVLLQWNLEDCASRNMENVTRYLTLETSPGEPTDEYRTLCKDFYLRF